MDDLANWASRFRERHHDKKIIFIFGNFNIVHSGHIRLINFAKSCGDVLVVGLLTDGADGTLVSFEDRIMGVTSLQQVDSVVRLEPDDVVGFIDLLRPFAIVKGREHASRPNPEHEVIRSYGGHLIFSSGDTHLSSMDLIRNELIHNPPPDIEHDSRYLDRRKISFQSLRSFVNKFDTKRLIVIGDLILDEYIYCDPIGMSQEDPTIVVSPIRNQLFAGGAAIVSAHLCKLGAEVSLYSVVGRDPRAEDAVRLLKGFGVKHNFVIDDSRPTILKQRYRAGSKTLLRVNHLRSHDIEAQYQEFIIQSLKTSLNNIDGVIFSDFNYGLLPQQLVDAAIDLCNSMSIPFFVDSQSSSQFGDVSRFKGAQLISATEREVRLALSDFRSGLQHIANGLLAVSGASGLVLKLGEDGLLATDATQNCLTDELKSLNPNPRDVAGAGDALLAASALAMLSGASLWESAYVGSVAAALQISKVGNIPLTSSALLEALG